MEVETSLDPDYLDESNKNNIDDYTCCICQLIPNPQTAIEDENCGHLFCENCINQWLKGKIYCPICKMKISKRLIKDKNKIVYRHLLNLVVKCHESNCDWKGLWNEYYEHLKNAHNIEINFNNNYYELYKYYKSTTHVHPLKFLDTTMDNGWYCENKYSPSKCLGEIDDFEKSKNQKRFRCMQCDYDLCEKCMNKNYDPKYIIKNDDSGNRSLYLLNKTYLSQIHEHPLIFLDKTEDTGWICKGNDLVNGCYSGISSPNKSSGIPRFRCQKCNFNLCENCMNYYKKKAFYEINNYYKVSVHSHPLIFLGVSDRDDWLCDGKDLKEKCLSNLTDFYQTKGVERFRCEICNYDLCKNCMDFYYLQKGNCTIY